MTAMVLKITRNEHFALENLFTATELFFSSRKLYIYGQHTVCADYRNHKGAVFVGEPLPVVNLQFSIK